MTGVYNFKKQKQSFIIFHYMYLFSENPELLEAVNTKFESLHDKLKTVYVESQGSNTEVQIYYNEYIMLVLEDYPS